MPESDVKLPMGERWPVQGAPVIENPKFQVRGLNFYYGSSHALHDISLDIAEKKVTTFIGPSGCGKTTLIRCFNRIFELHPGHRASGEIILDGDNILAKGQDVHALRAKVGMVFQKPTPFPMSVYDNIAFGVKLYERLPRRAMDDRIEWALNKAALWEEVKGKLLESGTRLSGGQQQRLCIARAIAIRPEVLLLDEPASSLDPYSSLKIEALITELKADYTIVLVTHNMQQAARVSDYAAFLFTGDLIEYKDTDTLFTNPSSQQTDAYITGRYG